MIRPINNNVLCEAIKEEDITPSGIVLVKGGLYDPFASENQSIKAKVISAPKDSDVRVGDTVVCIKHKEDRIDDLFLIKAEYIIGVYEQKTSKDKI